MDNYQNYPNEQPAPEATATGKAFCTSCGNWLTDNSPFCTSCGAKVDASAVYAAPSAPTYAPPAPTYAPPAPAYVPPAAPIYTAPVKESKKTRFPAAPMVFLVMMILYSIISFFTYSRVYVGNMLQWTELTLMFVGLIVFRKRTNILFGAALVLMAIIGMINSFQYYPAYYYLFRYMDENLLVVLQLLPYLFILIVGISYFIPAKVMFVFKTIFSIFYLVYSTIAFFVNLVNILDYNRYADPGSIVLSFFMYTLPFALAMITYSPSKQD